MHGALDRLSPALVASDLTVTDHLDNAHFVAALGLASQVYPIASPLVRMYLAHDKGAVHEARACACAFARKAAARRGVRLSVSELVKVGRLALEYSVNKTCPRCGGTKYELIPGTTCLSNKVCTACNGDGRRTLPRKHRALIVEVVARIERIESNLDVIVAQRV